MRHNHLRTVPQRKKTHRGKPSAVAGRKRHQHQWAGVVRPVPRVRTVCLAWTVTTAEG